MAMIEAALGDGAALAHRIDALAAMIAQGSLGAGPVVPAIGRAAKAFAEAVDAGCAPILGPVAAEVVRIGGSGAQQQAA